MVNDVRVPIATVLVESMVMRVIAVADVAIVLVLVLLVLDPFTDSTGRLFVVTLLLLPPPPPLIRGSIDITISAGSIANILLPQIFDVSTLAIVLLPLLGVVVAVLAETVAVSVLLDSTVGGVVAVVVVLLFVI